MKQIKLANIVRLAAALAVIIGSLAKGAAAQDASAPATPPARTFRVSIDTSGLIGHPAGPFKINFQLVDGDRSRRNSVAVRDVSAGTGGAFAPSVERAAGGVSGDLASGVVIADTSFVNDFTQEFTPGARLSFELVLTTNAAPAGARSDSFTFAILDRGGLPIPTLAGDGASPDEGDGSGLLLAASFGEPPAFEVFETDATKPPAAGGPPVKSGAPEVNQMPVVQARGLVLDAGADGTASVSPADLDAGSFDPDAGDTIILSISPAGPFGVGTHRVSFVVKDSRGGWSGTEVIVTVLDRSAPVIASVPAAQTVAAAGSCQALVPDLRASVTASDNVTAQGALAVTQEPTAGSPLGVGEHVLTFYVRDAAGNTATATTQLKVTDGQPPAINASLEWANLVNRTVGQFRVRFSAEDGCGASEAKAVMTLPAGAETFEVLFEPQASSGSYLEVKFDAGQRRVLLKGADESAAREQLRQLLADGGVRLMAGQLVRLHRTGGLAAPNAGQDQFTYAFWLGALIEVKAPAPSMRVDARDAAGNASTATVSPTFRK